MPYLYSVTSDQQVYPRRPALELHNSLIGHWNFYKYAYSVALRCDFPDVKADMELHCPHMTCYPMKKG